MLESGHADLATSQEPFSPPPIFDDRVIAQLNEIVMGKQAETQDNLWLLQTDPAYFHSVASYWAENNLHAASGAKTQDKIREQDLANRVICYSVTQVREWQDIGEELCNVRRQYKTHQQQIKSGQPLPTPYDRALCALWLRVSSILNHKATHVEELVFVSPAWKSMWEVLPHLSQGPQVALQAQDSKAVDPKTMYKSERHTFLSRSSWRCARTWIS